MPTHLQSERIVKRCIRHVLGFGGRIASEQTLQKAGILTSDQARFLRDTIALDIAIGVPSVSNHRIRLTYLNAAIGMTVLQLQKLDGLQKIEIDAEYTRRWPRRRKLTFKKGAEDEPELR